MDSESIQTCVTSPPYWGLRDYGVAGQLGLEATPEEFVANMVEVFREVKRVMKDDGTLWLNLGDSYAGTHTTYNGDAPKWQHGEKFRQEAGRTIKGNGLKTKDLCGIPWRVAFALQADGWYLRSDIIWHKPNPMPESVTDRPTKSHEYIFMLTKSDRYFYDADAIKEPIALSSIERLSQPNILRQSGSTRANGGAKTNGNMKAVGDSDFRNKRTVWTIATQPYSEAHFATFPEELPKLCILAGSKPGDMVLDPFGGSGTTGKVALELGRSCTLIELNPKYCELINKRCDVTPAMF